MDENEQIEKERFVMQASTMVDLLAFAEYIAKASSYGKKPSSQAWGYTRRFLADYGDANELEAFIELWKELGVMDELEAAKWVLRNERIIP